MLKIKKITQKYFFTCWIQLTLLEEYENVTFSFLDTCFVIKPFSLWKLRSKRNVNAWITKSRISTKKTFLGFHPQFEASS